MYLAYQAGLCMCGRKTGETNYTVEADLERQLGRQQYVTDILQEST